MVSTPPPDPVTIPVPVMVATVVVLLVQVPPPPSVRVVVPPWHNTEAPLIGAGNGFTVTTVVAVPQVVVYTIVVVPESKPKTLPALSIEATVVVPLDHVPPAVESDKL